ncbi:MAG: metallophosphoesterase [Candidatus Omnitrophica bacterium]|nr:metallophosphoesterase [Candidatus Omnitrophota bacterium]
MKIGVISDTHISEKTHTIPACILNDFKNAEMIIHCGDLIDLSVLTKLKSVCKVVAAVWGNMDPLEVKDKLPEKEIINVGTHRIGIMHGLGAPNNLIPFLIDRFKQDKVEMIIFGHSHTPCNEKRDGIIFFNPGSATDKVFAPYRSYGIIEIGETIKATIVKVKDE